MNILLYMFKYSFVIKYIFTFCVFHIIINRNYNMRNFYTETD